MNNELKDFISFLYSTWGILATIVTLFPFGNSIFKILYIPKDSKNQFSVSAWLCSSLVLYFIFVFREDIANLSAKILMWLFVILAIFGIICLWIYMGWSSRLKEKMLELTNTQKIQLNGFTSRWVFFGVLFCLSFSLFTAAFTILSTKEYIAQKNRIILTDKEIIFLITNVFDNSFFRMSAQNDSYAAWDAFEMYNMIKRNIEKFLPSVKDPDIRNNLTSIIKKLYEIIQLPKDENSKQNIDEMRKEIITLVNTLRRLVGLSKIGTITDEPLSTTIDRSLPTSSKK